jgi:glycosyltransferase involved in cell wall biosynthesis
MMSCFNEEDVLDEVIAHWIAQGCDLHVLDNWSTDRSWPILAAASQRFGRHLTIERFPREQPNTGSWREILARKEDIAFCHKGRWLIHTDADEIRCSPFAPFTLADAMHMVDLAGWNRIDFTVMNHRPVDARPALPGSLASTLPYFEFGTKPGHFIQKKAWLQGASKVRLAESGGHTAEFDDARDCPYHFLLHHYPLRSVEHGQRKINRERLGRWSAQELEAGWHHHYDELAGDARLIWDIAALHDVREDFWARHGLQILSGIQR